MHETVFELESPMRADLAVLGALHAPGGAAPRLARARLKGWFEAGWVWIDGRPARQPSAPLGRGSHRLELRGVPEPEWEGARVPARARVSREGRFLDPVYRDGELLVLHKCSGVPSVPLKADESETAVGAALAWTPSLEGVGRGGLEPGLLHRLDTGTSGLLAFALHDEAFHRLRAAWKGGGVRKHYRALVRPLEGAEPLPSRIELPLGHDLKQPKRMRALVGARDGGRIRGKPVEALTLVHSCRPVGLAGASRAAGSGGLHEVEVEIRTGAMHQIRCHLATLGWPIQGDPIYGAVPSRRLWLHAWRLEIPSPAGPALQLEAVMPEGWVST